MCLFNSCFAFIAYLNLNQSNSKNELDNAFVGRWWENLIKKTFDAYIILNVCKFVCMYLQSNRVTPHIPFGSNIAWGYKYTRKKSTLLPIANLGYALLAYHESFLLNSFIYVL